jgi:hypothetical protein
MVSLSVSLKSISTESAKINRSSMNTQPRWSPVGKQVVDASGEDQHPKSQAMRSAWQPAQCNIVNKAAAASGAYRSIIFVLGNI